MTKGEETAKGRLAANKKKEELNRKTDVRTRKHSDLGPAGLGMDLKPLLQRDRRAQNWLLVRT